MSKIRISKKEIEIEGEVQEGMVKPFGSAGHLVISKKHRGKYANVVLPDEARYGWLLSDKERKEISAVCSKIVKQQGGKLERIKLQTIDNIKNVKFSWSDLIKVYDILKKSKKHKHLVAKLKESYNL